MLFLSNLFPLFSGKVTDGRRNAPAVMSQENDNKVYIQKHW